MNKAIFLDRDGVVIEDIHHLHRQDQIRFIDGAGRVIKRFNDLGYLVFIVTNQPVVAYGMVSEEGVKRINDLIVSELEKDGGEITEIYYCSHHPTNAKIEEYKVECECRKPSPGMLLMASREYGVDMNKSYMVGDRISDVIAGRDAGCKTVLIKTAESYRRISGKDYDLDVEPDFIVNNLNEALEVILAQTAAK